MTLIELLVVIVILTTLVGAAIPLLSPANDDRRLREATRNLNTYITGAQARAIAINRPFGIALKRLSQDTQKADDNGVCLEVFYIEQPAPYSGFDANSRTCVALHPDKPGFACVRFVSRGNGAAPSVDGLPIGWDEDLFPTSMIRPGDVIETGGTRLVLQPLDVQLQRRDQWINIRVDANGYYERQNGTPQITALPINDSGRLIIPKYDNDGNELGTAANSQPAYWTEAMPYKILRQAAPASDQAYQLPEGTAIDLRASGVGNGEYFYWPGVHDPRINDVPHQIQIMFTPEGRVGRVSFSTMPHDTLEDDIELFDQPVVENVYLLLGQRANIPAPVLNLDPSLQSSSVNAATTDEARAKLRENKNWLSGNSRWIVIGSETGRITTVENAFVDLGLVLTAPSRPFDMAAQGSEEMRSAQILAAREFTREMSQLGGR